MLLTGDAVATVDQNKPYAHAINLEYRDKTKLRRYLQDRPIEAGFGSISDSNLVAQNSGPGHNDLLSASEGSGSGGAAGGGTMT